MIAVADALAEWRAWWATNGGRSAPAAQSDQETAHDEAARITARAAALVRAAQEALMALTERDACPIEIAERDAIFGTQPADRPYIPGDPDPLRDGLLRSARGPKGFQPRVVAATSSFPESRNVEPP